MKRGGQAHAVSFRLYTLFDAGCSCAAWFHHSCGFLQAVLLTSSIYAAHIIYLIVSPSGFTPCHEVEPLSRHIPWPGARRPEPARRQQAACKRATREDRDARAAAARHGAGGGGVKQAVAQLQRGDGHARAQLQVKGVSARSVSSNRPSCQ